MPYGKSKPNVSSISIIERAKEENQKIAFARESLNFEDSELDAINNKCSSIYYEENQDALPPGALNITKEKTKSKPSDGYILINQSLIKRLVDKFQVEKDFCPRNIKECVMGDKRTPPTEPMLAGKFFESLALGSTTGSDPVLDLPRKRLSKKQENLLKSLGKPLLGDKRIDQIRLEEQVERFKVRSKALQTTIVQGVNTHVKILKRWNDKYLLSGELDWFPTPILYNGVIRLAIIDVKVTSNVDSTFGDFSWGAPQFMDHLQADMYYHLIQDIDFDLNPHLKGVITPDIQDLIAAEQAIFLYWVWGYQKEPLIQQEKFVERGYRENNGSMLRQQELKERIRKAIAILEREEAFGWGVNPIPDVCKNCMLNQMHGGDCEASIISKI